ncbi:MAG: creatininase family protein [Wenzhouxiangellaceae bacterium]
MLRPYRTACLVLLLASAPAFAGEYLGRLSWPEAATALSSKAVVIIPFAAGAKEHGLHLPLDTDAVIMNHLLDAAAAQADVVIAPPVVHGWFPAFRDYPGTEIADANVFQDYLKQIAQSLIKHGARRLAFLNMGIGKASGLPITIVARDISADHGVPALVVSWEDLETAEATALQHQQRGGHADEIETSIMLYLQPDRVNLKLAVTDYRESLSTQSIGYRPGRFSRDHNDIHYSESGVYGDPRLATAETGREVLAIMQRNWLQALEEFAQTPLQQSE